MDKNSATFMGKLYIVATPIGNLSDITERAIQTLKSVDFILAEDTRHSRTLLQHLSIAKPLLSFHAFNEQDKTQEIIKNLQKGISYALISDAGTPLISDPGFSLVHDARRHEISVIPIPGACALITALSASGIPCDQFLFKGFLPATQEARQKQLNNLKSYACTVVLYESPHRICDCLEDIEQVYGANYEYMLAKELTKTYERFLSGNSDILLQWLRESPAHSRGEFVVILPAIQKNENEAEQQDKQRLETLLAELPLKQAVHIAAKLSDTPKNALYKMALELKKTSS